MKLTLEGIRDRQAWEKAGIALPGYDVETVQRNGRERPVWAHFGIGNIFRIFLGSIADRLIEDGDLDSGLSCVETFDYETVTKIYQPYDNLALAVYLAGDGSKREKVFGCFAEAVEGKRTDPESWSRLQEIFSAESLQMVSFTITEKGYALRGRDGQYFDFVKKDLENGPDQAGSAMTIVTSLLHQRYLNGGQPLALVSMDNCSQNGQLLRNAVLEVANAWKEKGFVDEGFLTYVSDESKVSFPWTMIDKITPRPGEEIARELTQRGVEDMDIVITSKRTYIAPFVNAEEPQYLVIEDSFPNGRPPLEKAGVYMTDRETVNKSERMKVTVCLNPVHSALGPYGMLLGHENFADNMSDPELLALADLVGKEGMEFVENPKILSPEAFLEECLKERFPNHFLGDTSARIVTDESQGLAIRFGENIKACAKKYGSAERLDGISLALAGWLRYVLGIDDQGQPYVLSPDPLAPVYQEELKHVKIGDPESAEGALRPILENANVFGVNLYEAGIGEKVEAVFREEIAGRGAVRETLKKYLS